MKKLQSIIETFSLSIASKLLHNTHILELGIILLKDHLFASLYSFFYFKRIFFVQLLKASTEFEVLSVLANGVVLNEENFEIKALKLWVI